MNRAVLEDDLMLPLPCGSGMALRPIAVPSGANRLNDVIVESGSGDRGEPFSEYPRTDYIAGSISADAAPDARLYYLGKYEVTEDQYAAVMNGECPKPSMAGTLPREDISWFDAVIFTQRLSEWLLENAHASLPQEDGKPTYLRLPTETEWEYAVRGGMAVTDSQRRDPLFPMPSGSIGNYAWYDSAESCGGGTQPVGLKKPNPLGLHDMLGNVQEMVLTPFRMTVEGRLHGQVGGFVAKGGSCNTRSGSLRSGLRQEYPFFDVTGGKAQRAPLTGFRVALVAPVQTTVLRIEALRDDWQDAGRLRSLENEEDPLALLSILRETAEDPRQRAALARIETGLVTEMQSRNAVDARSARMAIVAGAQMIRTYRRDLRIATGLAQALAACGEDADCAERIDGGRVARSELIADIGSSSLLDLMGQVERDYSQALLESQLEVVVQQYAAYDSGGFVAFARGFVALIAEQRKAPRRSNRAILKAVTELR
ncbi:MAG: SUMF1/EgtB/PvdO family nonheme iron enzyme [Rhodospirillales bacterium]|nr:SUMF1/EgtB/PvdO family nonheme iron enzyme [Rhodospirillales bacterium]